MSSNFEKIVSYYKNKDFKKLKKEIEDLPNDDVNNNLKTLILSNCMLNRKEDGTGIEEDYLDLACFILDKNIDISKKISVGEENYSLAYMAIMAGDLDIFKKIIDLGFNINEIERGANYLFHSIALSKSNIANYLIDENIDIMPFKNHPSVLNIAIVKYVKMADTEIVKKMLDKGYNFDNEHENVENPIILALKYGEDLTNVILDSNYKFNLTGGSNTPFELFSYAADDISLELFKKIVEKIKNDLPDVNYGIVKSIPAIHMLIGKRKVDYLKVLLDAGLDVNIRVIINKSVVIYQDNISGMTPLLYATYAGYNEIVDLLIEYGADPNTKDLLGHTPISISKNVNRETFLSLMSSPIICLTENMLNSNTEIKNPIHFLAEIESDKAVDTMKKILSERANQDVIDVINQKTVFPSNKLIDGFTPLMIACAVKNKEMIRLLANDDRVDINSQNEYGSRAIYELFKDNKMQFSINQINSNEETMELIKNNGEIEEKDTETESDKEDDNSETLLVARELIERGAELDFKIEGVKFFKTLDVNAKKMIKGFVEKDKKGFFDWIFKR